jgi:GcrA cell cycle regulator
MLAETSTAERLRPRRRRSDRTIAAANAGTLPQLWRLGNYTPPLADVVVPQFMQLVGCKYPIGDLSDPDFRFCNALALPGKPYCDAHQRLCYVPRRIPIPGKGI